MKDENFGRPLFASSQAPFLRQTPSYPAFPKHTTGGMSPHHRYHCLPKANNVGPYRCAPRALAPVARALRNHDVADAKLISGVQTGCRGINGSICRGKTANTFPRNSDESEEVVAFSACPKRWFSQGWQTEVLL